MAERLGFRYVDEAIIALASDKAKLDPGRIADAEHRKSLLDRIIGALPTSNLVSPSSGSSTHDLGATSAASSSDFRSLIREVIAEVAVQGNAVIVAHAASMALAGSEGVLRVFLTASEQTRVKRLVETHDAGTDKEALKLLKESDAERRAYLLDFYKVKEELPTHYDLVVNTDSLSAARAAAIVVFAATD